MHDFAPPSPPPAIPRWLRVLLLGSAAACVAVYAIVLARHMAFYASSSDSSGYFNSARLLSQGELFTGLRILPGHSATEFGDRIFQPLGFEILRNTGRMAPTYPIGLPLHLIAASWIAGWDYAAIAVNLFAAIASGAFFWAIARQLELPTVWASVGVFWLWLCPLFLFCALQPMSDLLATTWSLVVLYGALRAREHWQWGLFCGLAAGVATLVRPTNALLAVPILVAVGLRGKSLVAIILAGLPGAGLFAFYNWRVYGSPFVTGYGDISAVFGPVFFRHNLAHFAYWIPALLSPAIAAVLFLPFFTQGRRRGHAVLASWFLILAGFYTFYYHAGETWWYLRFLLPAFPALILMALAAISSIAHAARLRSALTVLAVAGVVTGVVSWETKYVRRFEIMTFAQGERNYPDAAHWLQKNTPANSAVFCMQVSGALYYYSDFLLMRWDQIDPSRREALFDAIAAQKRPVYAALFAFETSRALEKTGGHWIRLATIGQITFWQRQPDSHAPL